MANHTVMADFVQVGFSRATRSKYLERTLPAKRYSLYGQVPHVWMEVWVFTVEGIGIVYKLALLFSWYRVYYVGERVRVFTLLWATSYIILGYFWIQPPFRYYIAVLSKNIFHPDIP